MVLPETPLETTNAPAGASATVRDISPQAFIDANRIHVQDGSLFVDGGLVVHRRELDPKNEAALRQKLTLTYGLHSPSFFEKEKRMEVALNLGHLVPVATETKRQKLLQDIQKFNQEVATGRDPELTKALTDRFAPMRAIVHDTTHPDHNADPVGVEELKNGLALFLLCREKLTRNGYFEPVVNYVEHHERPDQVSEDLAEKLGVTPLQLRIAAYQGGVGGVGKLLGLEPAFTARVGELVEHISKRDFSMNDIEHWHEGRKQLGENASMQETIASGMQARIDKTIHDLRLKTHGIYESPEAIKREEQRIAGALNLVEPIERAMLFALGYEICYTPERTADHIAFHKSIYGLHRKTADDLRDVTGTYRIYFSGKGNEKDSLRTLRHEIAHNLWPAEFTPEEVETVDKLANADRTRFDALHRITTSYKPQLEAYIAAYQQAPNAQAKQAIQQQANEAFAPLHVQVGDVLPHLRAADQLTWLVSEARDRLSVEGKLYNRSGYDEPATRFREMISRYSELQYVAYREQPEMQALLAFVAPGMTQTFRGIYLPHLERVYHKLTGATPPASNVAAPALAEEEPKAKKIPQPEDKAVQGKIDQRPEALPAIAAAGAAGAAPETTKPIKLPQPEDKTVNGKIDERPEVAATTAHDPNCTQACCAHNAQPKERIEARGSSVKARYPLAVSALAAMGVHTESTDDCCLAR
jgi:hypothetical protein